MFLPIPYMDDNPLEGDKAPVLALMIANACAAVFWKPEWYAALGFVPAAPHWWTFLTAQFLHIGGLHLCAAMWLLWLFGDNVSKYLGWRFWPLYFLCGAAGFGAHWALNPGSAVPVVGSGGGVAGVAAAYVVFFPKARLRCLFLARRSRGTFSISALFFGLIVLAASVLFMAGTPDWGLAWSAQAGGLVAGLAAAAALLRPAGTGGTAVALSGGAGVRPLAGVATVGAGAAIEAAIREGRDSDALDAFAAALRRNPAFELSAPAQLWAADRLARAGHPHMARSALERFLARHPQDPNLPHALSLLGFVHQNFLGDLDSALAAWRRALSHPAASGALLKDLDARIKPAEARLKRTFTEAPREDLTYAVVMEGGAPPSQDQARIIAESSGDTPEHVVERLKKVPGFVLRWVSVREAWDLSEKLEAAGFPVVVVAEPSLLKLAPPEASGPPEASSNGLRLRLSGGLEAMLPWDDCLFIAAGAVGFPKSSEKQRGLFELSDLDAVFLGPRFRRRRRGWGLGSMAFEKRYGSLGHAPEREYETSLVHLPVLELLRRDGGRYRWTPSEDLQVDEGRLQVYFDALQELLTAAPGIPVERGALAAFERAFPEGSVFPSVAEWDAHLFWQAQLAALKRGSA
ncbi:MAG: rhomboid family intramembrane serine protease [Elusimicrobia bacterium]|nr:rhomboid family intramembrane serine protease [Elusimicrobiota bacterium]